MTPADEFIYPVLAGAVYPRSFGTFITASGFVISGISSSPAKVLYSLAFLPPKIPPFFSQLPIIAFAVIIALVRMYSALVVVVL